MIEIKTIAFIGAGVMGASMVKNLLKNNYQVNVYNRSYQKALALEQFGAKACNSIAKAVKDCDLVISIVGYPNDVQEVWLSDNGAFANMKKGAIGIDMTTSTPKLAQQLYQRGKELGIYMSDAPVTGGDIGAREGRLTILFGGDKEVFDNLEGVFKSIGKTFVYFGPQGSGQYAKMCNQIAIASGMLGVCEAIVMAQRCKLDAKLVIDTLSQGAAGSFSLTSYGPRILNGDFNPGFFIKHFVKDMKIALDCASELKINLPGLDLAYRLYDLLKNNDLGDLGTQALYKFYVQENLNSKALS